MRLDMRWIVGIIVAPFAILLMLIAVNLGTASLHQVDTQNTNGAITFLENQGYWVLAGGVHEVPGDLNPSLNNTWDVGSTTKQWAEGHFGTLVATSANITTLNMKGDVFTDRWLGYQENTFFGEGVAGAGNLAHTAGVEGFGLSAFGYHALYANTIGHYNTAFGYSALAAVTNSGANAAFGAAALGVNDNSYSSAFGVAALGASTGQANAAFGADAGQLIVAGDSNTFIGRASGSLLLNGSGNVFLGVNSGNPLTTANNTLAISNSSTLRPLILGTFNNVASPGITLNSPDAGDIPYTLQNVSLSLQDAYWNSSNISTPWNAKILHNMITAGATPKSRLTTSIGAVGAEVSATTIQNNNGVISVGINTASPTHFLEIDNGYGDQVQLGGLTNTTGNMLSVYRNEGGGSTDAGLVSFVEDASTQTRDFMTWQNDGTGILLNASTNQTSQILWTDSHFAFQKAYTISTTAGDLTLAPNGYVAFGTYTANTTIPYSGYIMLKDAAGNPHKVMVAD